MVTFNRSNTKKDWVVTSRLGKIYCKTQSPRCWLLLVKKV